MKHKMANLAAAAAFHNFYNLCTFKFFNVV